MEENLLTYKCPCCGGAIEFDPSLQKLKCPYCDTEFETETLKAFGAETADASEDDLSFETASETRWDDSESDGMSAYICKSCGGEIIAEATTAALSCPFCGNPVVMTGKLSGDLRPDQVIPFSVEKEAAVAALSRHFKGKRLLPKVFSNRNHLDEIKGIYLPFWVFDADTDANIRYRATKSVTWSDRNYIYTRVTHHLVIRSGTLGFDAIPADGSSGMDDALSESIEPFDFTKAVDFSTAYLPGFLAERYDVSSETCLERVKVRVKNSTEQEFARTVQGYGSVVPEHSAVRLTKSRARYVLCPVWILNTTFEGQKYTFAVNGQTGKLVGNLPMSKSAYAKWLAGLTGAVGGGIFLLLLLMHYLGG